MTTEDDLTIKTLGAAQHDSPLRLSTTLHDQVADFVPDDQRVLMDVEARADEEIDTSLRLEKAGPRQRIYFDPSGTRVGIVTCGGLCPGLNGVIRGMVHELHHTYQVREVLGYRYGYQGLNREKGVAPMTLHVGDVLHIHKQGGSLLGVSRGHEDPKVVVNTLVANDVQILFCIGGDGTLRGAHAIHQEIEAQGREIAVVGVPKTIDNDISFVDKTFGFDTAVEMARLAIDGAHTEALSARNGIGLVKVMGRDVGFIAAAATLASRDVNFCLVPEVQFDLDGPNGLLLALERRLRSRRHAVIVVAEGCARSMVDAGSELDASGNVRYASADLDIGPHLSGRLKEYYKRIGMPVTLKYIDPSYMIRSVPANANDSIFCDILARNAVHAGMAGKTDLVIGSRHNVFTHVPLELATSTRKQIDPDGALWLAVTETTGQPSLSNAPKGCLEKA
jgi:6-phosphofructokinase 1